MFERGKGEEEFDKGANFCMIYGEVKREEMRLFHREISPWEREHLLLNV